MPEEAIPNFNPPEHPGGLVSKPDERDILYPPLASALPPFDWDAGYDVQVDIGAILPVKNQNGSGSCGGQGFSQEDGVIEAKATGSLEERSAKYVIAQTFVMGKDGVMLGSYGRDNAKLLKNQGVCREPLCPSYMNGGVPPTDAFMNRPGDITPEARADAGRSKAISFAYLVQNAHGLFSIDDFAQAIGQNQGLVMTIDGSNNGTWGSRFPKPPVEREWGHFMYCGKAKLIDGKKYIGAIQSWGVGIGENGWQWFGEEWFATTHLREAVTFVFDDGHPLPPSFVFTRDLTIGSTGIDVKALQVYLNRHDCILALDGPGSPGQETSYFGNLTRQALATFQEGNGITPAAGYFGPKTRAYVNANP